VKQAVELFTRAQLIEEATHDILSQVNKQLMDNQLKALVPEAHSIDLVISSQSVQLCTPIE